MMSPVGAHVGNSVRHLWSDHIRPLVKDDFYTQAQSDHRFIKKRSVRKGFVSCPATAWYPDEGDDSYWTDGGMRYSTTGPVTSFYCNASLPHGAKVKSVRFSLHDSIQPDFVACGLVRRHLITHNEVDMAAVNTDPPIGDSEQVDTTILKPTVDNKNFGYVFKCVLFGSDDNIGFYGASAGYTMTAAKGAAN